MHACCVQPPPEATLRARRPAGRERHLAGLSAHKPHAQRSATGRSLQWWCGNSFDGAWRLPEGRARVRRQPQQNLFPAQPGAQVCRGGLAAGRARGGTCSQGARVSGGVAKNLPVRGGCPEGASQAAAAHLLPFTASLLPCSWRTKNSKIQDSLLGAIDNRKGAFSKVVKASKAWEEEKTAAARPVAPYKAAYRVGFSCAMTSRKCAECGLVFTCSPKFKGK